MKTMKLRSALTHLLPGCQRSGYQHKLEFFTGVKENGDSLGRGGVGLLDMRLTAVLLSLELTIPMSEN